MLINTNINTSPKVGDIVGFKLVTGEEVIAKLAATDLITPYGNAIRVEKPVVAHVHMVSPQQAALAFMPFMAACDETTVTIPCDRILTIPAAPRADVKANYLKSTTGLEVPSSPLPGLR